MTAQLNRNQVCVVLQDGDAGYGVTCRSIDQATTDGFSIALEGPDGKSSLVSVAPGKGDGLAVRETTNAQARAALKQ